MNHEPVVVFWFRRDLRTHDNAGFHAALMSGYPVLPVFIFDTEILSELPKDDARVTFIHQQLENMNAGFGTHRRALAVFHGTPGSVFLKLLARHSIAAVYANHDYEPYAAKRDAEIRKLLEAQGVPFHTSKDQVIFEKDEIVKNNGTPYVVFTPYANRWKSGLDENRLRHFRSEDHLDRLARHAHPFLSLKDIGFETSEIRVPEYDLQDNNIENYGQTRDYPGIDGTSRLGPHLRFGTISIRHAVKKAMESRDGTFLNELIWREFFMQILWHFPDTVDKAFRAPYDRIGWRHAEADFRRWREGRTGYPIVDAGMRQLNQTGWMHNRVRMVTASFLCKHLLIDWRWGEGYFAEKLLDYEQSSNVGNWQWAAGSGVDAAPYFRIFNPVEQAKKFDKDFTYIKRWVPEFGTKDYPQPMVDHKEARERALKTYRDAVG